MVDRNPSKETRLNPRQLKWGLLAFSILALASEVGTENVILTTYYPAPSGVYTQLISTQKTIMARDGGMLIAGPDPGVVAGVKMYVSGGNFVVANPSSLRILDGAGTTQPVYRCLAGTAVGALTTDGSAAGICGGGGSTLTRFGVR